MILTDAGAGRDPGPAGEETAELTMGAGVLDNKRGLCPNLEADGGTSGNQVVERQRNLGGAINQWDTHVGHPHGV